MWGFAHFAKNIVKHTSKASANIIKQTSYTPIQKVWANMQTTSLQSRALSLPSLSALTIFNLREILQKAAQEAELPAAIQGSILEGTNVCSVIKKLSRLSIGRIQLNIVDRISPS